jgi:hypothetical protein
VSRISLGDVFVLEGFESARPPAGRFYVCDVLPFEGPVVKVCLENSRGVREWVPVADLENRKLHRRVSLGA